MELNPKFTGKSYYIVVWRRTAFYMVNYVLPALLINIISLFVFMMPSESGEKITLGISAMLNMCEGSLSRMMLICVMLGPCS